MSDARDPVRLMDEKLVDPALREALRQVSSAEPQAAEVAALVERLGDALSSSASSASWLSQLVTHGAGLKSMAVLMAGGAVLWAATKIVPAPAAREVATRRPPVSAPLETPATNGTHGTRASLKLAGPARDDEKIPSAPVAADERHARHTAHLSRSEPLPTARSAPVPERSGAARRKQRPAAATFVTPGTYAKSAATMRARSAAAFASSAATTPEPRQEEARVEGESELALITLAQSALKVAPRRALDLLDRHDSLYPMGHFAEEREVLWIDALSQLGMTRALEARARRFLATYPSSLHCARVRSLLEAARPKR